MNHVLVTELDHPAAGYVKVAITFKYQPGGRTGQWTYDSPQIELISIRIISGPLVDLDMADREWLYQAAQDYLFESSYPEQVAMDDLRMGGFDG